MKKNAAIALFVIALLFTAVNAGLAFYGQKTRHTPPGRVVKLIPGDIDSVAVYRGADVVMDFKRDESTRQWRFSAPAAGIAKAAADRTAVEEIMQFAARAEHRPGTVDLKTAGLDVPAQARQVVFSAGKESASIFLGGLSPDGQEQYFLTDADMDTPLTAPAALLRVFAREPSALRSHDVFDLAQKAPESITLAADGKETVLAHSEDGWVITAPFNWPADNDLVGGLLRVFLLMRADAFLDKVPDTARAALKVSLRLGKDTQDAEFFRAADGKTVYAVRGGRDEVYSFPASELEQLLHPQLSDILRRRVLDLYPGRAAAQARLFLNGRELRMTKTENGWTAAGADSFAVEEQIAANLLQLLHNLPLNRVVAETPDKVAYSGKTLTSKVQLFDAAGAELCSVAVTASKLDKGMPEFDAVLSGRPQVVELHPTAGMLLLQPFLAYRSRTLTRYPYEAVRKLRTVRYIDNGAETVYERDASSQFRQTAPKVRELPERSGWEVLELARQLAQLRCEGFVVEKKDNLLVYGLDRPLLKTILSVEDAPGRMRDLTLTVGRELTLGNPGDPQKYYSAMLDGCDYIFILNERFVDRLLANY